jgi:hypothetical protein
MPCCADGSCEDSICAEDKLCTDQICDDKGNCQTCGTYDQPCCEGNTCLSGFLCNDQKTCEYCGELFTPPCKDNECIGWYIPIDNECRDPFDEDPDYDVAVCQKLDPGYKSSIGRDWCLWSAAFHKKDISICEQILWGPMTIKCSEGGDPADYIVFKY